MSRPAATARPLRFLFENTPRPYSQRNSTTAAHQRTLNTTLTQYSPRVRHRLAVPSLPAASTTLRSFTVALRLCKGLRPETSNPEPPNPESQTTSSGGESTALSNESYHELADDYLDRLVSVLEEKAETNSQYEVEYSAGVLSIETPQGTWIINKQPPNKQIWLSSPVSGPKRFDYVGGGGAAGQYAKEGTDGAAGTVDVEGKIADFEDGGRWVYLRDGTGLSELVKEEIEVVVPGVLEG